MIFRALLIGILLLAVSFIIFAITPVRIATETVINIAPGSSASTVLHNLYNKNIIRNKFYFKILVILSRSADSLQAGDYEISKKITPLQLLNNFMIGNIKQYKVTIIEGWTFSQLLKYLQSNPDLIHKTKSLSNKKILMALHVNHKHPEGLFFPDTYFFKKNSTSDLDILKASYDKMQNVLKEEWSNKKKTSSRISNIYEALILASIIEKEVAYHNESQIVSSVYHNRLNKVMHLNADPSVIYGINGHFKEKPSKKDLATPGSYNTYLNYGLPPTPIALPGKNAIHAAMNPLNTDNLYFVANSDGSHHFSTNLRDHTNAVNRIYKTMGSK